MLLDRTGAIPDRWVRTEGTAPNATACALVAYEALPAALGIADEGALGVIVPNTVSVEPLSPHLRRLALIAVQFPAAGDGRGFSLARTLRRAGFTGRLRACGPLIPDQFGYALACGFDEVELPEASASRQSPEQWRRAAQAGEAYQRGYRREASILDRRRAGAGGG